jgi:hypothetical protein
VNPLLDLAKPRADPLAVEDNMDSAPFDSTDRVCLCGIRRRLGGDKGVGKLSICSRNGGEW